MTEPDHENQEAAPPASGMQPPEPIPRSSNDTDRGQDDADMAVRTTDLRTPGHVWPTGGTWTRRMTLVVYGITALLVVLTGYALMGVIVERLRITADDIHYGRPRTTHLAGFVGHGEERGVPTHFTAINLDRRVVLIELPGSDPKVARVIEGPYLFGANQSLTPIDLQLRDVDADGAQDLLVTIQREQVLYLNKEGIFRLPTPAEQAAISRGKP